MQKPIMLGAVAYDPKVIPIWDIIRDYFNNNGASIYNNYSYNYVDEKDMVVVVGLVNNSKEEQEWFKNNIVDSKYIRFEQGNHPENE